MIGKLHLFILLMILNFWWLNNLLVLKLLFVEVILNYLLIYIFLQLLFLFYSVQVIEDILWKRWSLSFLYCIFFQNWVSCRFLLLLIWNIDFCFLTIFQDNGVSVFNIIELIDFFVEIKESLFMLHLFLPFLLFLSPILVILFLNLFVSLIFQIEGMLHLTLICFGISILLNLVQTFKSELGPDETIVALKSFKSVFYCLKLIHA